MDDLKRVDRHFLGVIMMNWPFILIHALILDIRSVFVIPGAKEFRSKVEDEDKNQSKNVKLKPEDLLVYMVQESVQFNLKSSGGGEQGTPGGAPNCEVFSHQNGRI